MRCTGVSRAWTAWPGWRALALGLAIVATALSWGGTAQARIEGYYCAVRDGRGLSGVVSAVMSVSPFGSASREQLFWALPPKGHATATVALTWPSAGGAVEAQGALVSYQVDHDLPGTTWLLVRVGTAYVQKEFDSDRQRRASPHGPGQVMGLQFSGGPVFRKAFELSYPVEVFLRDSRGAILEYESFALTERPAALERATSAARHAEAKLAKFRTDCEAIDVEE